MSDYPELEPWQKEFLEGLKDKKRMIINQPRGYGKRAFHKICQKLGLLTQLHGVGTMGSNDYISFENMKKLEELNENNKPIGSYLWNLI